MSEEITREFPGYLGNGCLMDGAVKIRRGRKINGGGPKAFGGAKEWPCLTVEVHFTVRDGNERMASLSRDLEKWFKAHGYIRKFHCDECGVEVGPDVSYQTTGDDGVVCQSCIDNWE